MVEKKILAEKGILDILFKLSDKPLGFNELKVSINISPNTLLVRIKELTKAGLVEEMLIRTERRSLIKYALTKEGKKTIEGLGNVKDKYLGIKAQLDKLKEEKSRKEKEINELMSSSQGTNVSTANYSAIVTHGNVNISPRIDIDTTSKQKKNTKVK